MVNDDDDTLLDGFRLTDMPGHLLRRNHQRSFEIFNQYVGQDVTRQQIALLIALHQNPAASQTMLAEATGIDKATLREMLGRMIERGWVTRARQAADARTWAMGITPAGLVQLKSRIRQVRRAQEEILAPLPEALRPVFLDCLHRLIGQPSRRGDAESE